jgi:hypothetical protein
LLRFLEDEKGGRREMREGEEGRKEGGGRREGGGEKKRRRLWYSDPNGQYLATSALLSFWKMRREE